MMPADVPEMTPIAAKFDVSAAIHANDFMFLWHLGPAQTLVGGQRRDCKRWTTTSTTALDLLRTSTNWSQNFTLTIPSARFACWNLRLATGWFLGTLAG